MEDMPAWPTYTLPDETYSSEKAKPVLPRLYALLVSGMRDCETTPLI